jgi:CRP-like cAMP-binding protein
MLADLEHARWVILHMRRVTQIDLTALRILHQIAERMQRQGGELVFCEIHSEIGVGQEMDAAFEKVTHVGGGLGVKTFIGSDEALEYAENALLTSVGQAPLHPTERVALTDMDLCRGMTPEAIRAFDACLRRRRFDAGAKVFNINEPAESLYLVVQGEIEIRLPTTRHHYKRMRIYGAGQMFGEIAFLSPGRRTADAIALNSVEVLSLDRSRFTALEKDHPDVAILLLTALGNLQAEMLRRMTDQLQHFVQG